MVKRPPAHLATAVYAETEGNPFFVEEVFQHLSEEGRLFDAKGRWHADLRVEDLDVPEGIRLVIGRRVERLSPEARQVLTTAAVVGRSFDLALLEALGDIEGETLLTALEEAEAARLIQTASSGREVRWEFAHGLIRQTLESSLSLPRRQRAHLRVAEAMERVHRANLDRYASDMGHHLFQAGAAARSEKTVGQARHQPEIEGATGCQPIELQVRSKRAISTSQSTASPQPSSDNDPSAARFTARTPR